MHDTLASLATLGRAFLPDLGQPQGIFVALLSILVPLSIFVGRRNVRIRRLHLLQNLKETLLRNGDRAALPPGYDIIEARYVDDPARTGTSGWLREVGIYALPTLVFALVSACGFGLIFALGGQWLDAAAVLLQGLHAADGKTDATFAATTGLIVAAGFVGAYVWSVRYLILRVSNFDLSPLSFLSTAAHVLMTVFLAWVLRQVFAGPLVGDAVAVALVLGIAFLCGLIPTLGLNVLVDRLPSWLRLKRDVRQAGDIERAFPLDLLDGINNETMFRLNELDVAEVQGLATANPVELFVETPYPFGQILDWVAQAQLLAELGPDRFLKAREGGVRDMADLLYLAASDAGRALIRPILGGSGESDDSLRARLDCIAAKLHIRQRAYWADLLTKALDGPSAASAQAQPVGNVAQLKPTG